MNDFLQKHTWLAHVEFWWCAKVMMIGMITAISMTVILWCAGVIISSWWQSHQEHTTRRRRRRDYQVGSVCTPAVTRAWLAAIREQTGDHL